MHFAHRAVALPLVGLAILLSGCNEPAAKTAAPVSDMPANLAGELTSQSNVNLNDGSRNQSFELQLQAGTLYRVSSSGALKQPTLLLLSEDNRPVSGPRAEQLYLQPEQDGLYRLAISGSSPSDFGPFRLELNTAELTSEGELQPGADILGHLGSGTKQGGNRYTLQIAEPGLYELLLRSDEFDTVLKLRGAGVNRTDDDGAGGTDSRLLTMLQQGSYQVIAGGIDAADEGIYSLSFKRWEMPEGITLSDGDQLKLNEERSGMLTGHPQSYTLVIEQAGLLQVSMRSDDFDSLLELNGQGINTRDDDSGGDRDALISVAVEPGSYRIKAAQLDGVDGMFTLAAELSEVAMLGDSITAGETRLGRLVTGQPVATQLNIGEAGLYRITLRSSQFDALLGLQGAGLEEQDDDSAGGTNAQLELWLDAGDYQLLSGSYGDEGEGSFVLSVSASL